MFKVLRGVTASTSKTDLKIMTMWDTCRRLAKKHKLPAFPIFSHQVTILGGPSEFYENLIEKCKGAQKRIVIASLYLGTGPLEEKFLSVLSQKMKDNPSLSVHVLLDCLRGSRGTDKSSRTMLVPLIRDYGLKVSLYHTPRCRGWLKRIIPNRYNEIIGVQHMKLYLFDDDVIITGANLSNEYFTLRQDRYLVIKNCKPLGDFIAELTSKVSANSFQLDQNNDLIMKSVNYLNPVTSNFSDYVNNFQNTILEFYDGFSSPVDASLGENFDTIIYPMIEMGEFGIHKESSVTKELLEECDEKCRISLATGYFNITKDLADTIVKKSSAFFHFLMAHPKANGFYNAKGPAGGIPKGYSELAGRFQDDLKTADQQHRISLSEYEKNGWTFHAKGLWLSHSDTAPPVLTFVGSPNFGERSYHHDIECQFLLVTSNRELQLKLKEERDDIYKYAAPYTSVERQRKLPFWCYMVLYLFKTYL